MIHFIASFPDRVCVIFTAERNLKEDLDDQNDVPRIRRIFH